MPLPFRHMTPLRSENVGRSVVAAVRRGTPRVVMPRVANVLLLGEALSPRIGDLIAYALSLRPVARMFRISRGTTYHQAIASLQVDAQSHAISDESADQVTLPTAPKAVHAVRLT